MSEIFCNINFAGIKFSNYSMPVSLDMSMFEPSSGRAWQFYTVYERQVVIGPGTISDKYVINVLHYETRLSD